jgi:hypothetical protein
MKPLTDEELMEINNLNKKLFELLKRIEGTPINFNHHDAYRKLQQASDNFDYVVNKYE